MRKLKARRSSEAFTNEPRVHRQTVIRWVYLAIVAGLALWLIDLFFGGFFYLSSEGMVLGDPAVVATEFPVTVREVRVREGDHVRTGQVVALVSSQAVVESLARFASDQADRTLRLSDLRIRSQSVASIIELAGTRNDITIDARRQLDSLQALGWLPIDKRVAAVESAYRSSGDLAQLQAEQRVLPDEIAILTAAFAQADGAVEELRRLYGDGSLRSPIDGIVGSPPVGKGAVISAGEPLMELYGNDRFVLAYMPTGGVFQVLPGELVTVSTGLQTFNGSVVRVEPIAVNVPREFQRAFTPAERRQLIRVEFDPGEPTPPLFSKVTLRGADRISAWLRTILPRFL
jgi:multidrug resistance efflux pump